MMNDTEEVIRHLVGCLEGTRRDNGWCFVRKDMVLRAMKDLDFYTKHEHEVCANCPYNDDDNRIVRQEAHWVFGSHNGHDWMKCSECLVSQSGWTGVFTYCPNCGAYMNGEVVHDGEE